MTSSRVPPVPPDKSLSSDKTNPTQHRKIEKIEKVTKVSEVDDDETRARKFREMVEQQQEPDSEHPTPFDLFSSISSAPDTEPSVSSASNQEPAAPSPGPSVQAEEESPLPQSPDLWRRFDESPDVTPPGPTFEETSRSASRTFDQPPSGPTQIGGSKEKQTDQEKKAPGKKERSEESQLFGLPGKPRAPASRMAAEEKKGKQEIPPAFSPLHPAAALFTKKGEKTEKRPEAEAKQGAAAFQGDLASPQPPTRALKKTEREKEIPLQMPAGKKGLTAESKEEVAPKNMGRLSSLDKGSAIILPKEERGDHREKKKSPEEEISSPSLAPLLPEAIPVAQTAAAAAVSYLSHDILPIYFHMVGTIVAMTSPSGDSRTEFVLNAPSFANSKFYGATIAIERFATAPYSLNIRLTGSNEAVAAFNQNIPNLLAAFQRGKFSFTVNRIEAAYEKPLFRRKEAPGDKGLGKGK